MLKKNKAKGNGANCGPNESTSQLTESDADSGDMCRKLLLFKVVSVVDFPAGGSLEGPTISVFRTSLVLNAKVCVISDPKRARTNC